MAKSPKKDKKPAVSTEEIIQILTTSPIEKTAQKKTFLNNDGIDWSLKEEEEKSIKLWLSGERLQYEDDNKN